MTPLINSRVRKEAVESSIEILDLCKSVSEQVASVIKIALALIFFIHIQNRDMIYLIILHERDGSKNGLTMKLLSCSVVLFPADLVSRMATIPLDNEFALLNPLTCLLNSTKR